MAVHVAITRRVKLGREAEFEARVREFFRDSLAAAGVLGAQLIVPGPDAPVREYGILRSFATAAERDAFYASPMFRRWLAESRELTVDEPVHRELHGLEAWFRTSGVRPPRWKMALLTWLAVWPVSCVAAAGVRAWWPAGRAVWQSALAAAVVVVVLTWGVMPLLTRLARRWLAAGADAGS